MFFSSRYYVVLIRDIPKQIEAVSLFQKRFLKYNNVQWISYCNLSLLVFGWSSSVASLGRCILYS